MTRLQPCVWLCCLCFASGTLNAADESVAQSKRLAIKLFDAQGKPTSAARVYKSSNPRVEVSVDSEGVATLEDPQSSQSTLTITVEPEAPDCIPLRASVPVPLPQNQVLEFRFAKGISIGGNVVDEDSRPIASAAVTLTIPTKGSRPINTPYPTGQRTATTDESGRWAMQGVPENASWYLSVSHQDYVLPVENSQPSPSERTDALATKHRVTLLKGLEVSGRVLDQNGDPVPDAIVKMPDPMLRPGPFRSAKETKSNAKGEYRFKGLEAANTAVFAFKENVGMGSTRFTLDQRFDKPVDVTFEPRTVMRIRVTYPDGEPAAGVRLNSLGWRGDRMGIVLGLGKGETDADGVWSWDWAPPDAVQMQIIKSGYMSSMNQVVAAKGEERIVLFPEVRITGKVIDAATRKPLESFRAIPMLSFGAGRTSSIDSPVVGKDGQYTIRFNQKYGGYLVRIEADGYSPETSAVFGSDAGNVSANFSLTPARSMAGLVVGVDGKPLADATVFVLFEGEGCQVTNGDGPHDVSRRTRAKTDTSGKFRLPAWERKCLLAVVHESGTGSVVMEGESANAEIKLIPWGRIEGRLKLGDRVGANEPIGVRFEEPFGTVEEISKGFRLYFVNSATTDQEGRFTLNKVAPAPAHIAREVHARHGDMTAVGRGVSKDVVVEKNQTATVELGGTGTTVKGKLVKPQSAAGVSLNYGVRLGRVTPEVRVPGSMQGQSFRASSDGSFEINDLEPGLYRLQIDVASSDDAPDISPRERSAAQASLSFEVPSPGADRKSTPVDLGSVPLQMTAP